MTRIVPTVGRMVYYKSYGTPGGEFPSVDRSATITEVIDAENDIVSLCVFNPTGLFFNQNVKRGDKPGMWDWMPYQKEQAKKEERRKTDNMSSLLSGLKVSLDNPLTGGMK